MLPVYLDNNATTRPSKEVVSAVLSALEIHWHNPSSIHRPGQEAKHAIEIARSQVADLLGAKSRDVTFTGSGTEAIDISIRGTLGAVKKTNPNKNIIITTPIEHSAIRNLCKQLEETGQARVIMMPVDRSGVVDISGLESLIKEHASERGSQVALVSMQWVNNETGVVQPVHLVGEICDRQNVVFHCDATQWVGKMPTELGSDDSPKIDLLNCSPHKFHGPKGVGVLWVRRGVKLLPMTPGSQELGRRGGTEPVPAILGAGVAAKQAKQWVEEESNRESVASLRDCLERGILGSCSGSVINTTTDPALRIWSTTSIGFPRLEAEAMLLSLSERGVCVSAGSACASGSLDPSPVLLAMGVDEMTAHGSIRLSLGRESTQGEVDRAIELIEAVTAQLSRSMPA
jgi:cysteine desulfurase